MDEYTIFCTPKQARRALELGAPIRTIKSGRTNYTVLSDDVIEYDENTFTYVVSPTAEQMKGWLEEQGTTFDVLFIPETGVYKLYFRYKCEIYTSCKQATLAGIDAALNHLSNNKK